jgi:hypothetical protein
MTPSDLLAVFFLVAFAAAFARLVYALAMFARSR